MPKGCVRSGPIESAWKEEARRVSTPYYGVPGLFFSYHMRTWYYTKKLVYPLVSVTR